MLNMTNPEAGDQEDFAALFEESLKHLVSGFEPGQEVQGTITDINENSIFIDVGAKSEGVVDRQEYVDKSGQLTVGIGDEINVRFLNMDNGEFRFSSRISGAAAERVLEDAYKSAIPVEGVVVEERKGGYSVMIGGRKAFCPYSQIDLFGAGPAEQYLHNSFSFLITQFSDRDLVVSRRRVLEQERTRKREALVETLEPGMIVHGVVRNIRPFGVFVDLDGAEGLIPMGELAWEHVDDAASVVTVGQEIDVMVTAIDWPRDRISLSLRRAGADPWTDIETRWSVGRRTVGRVVRIIPPGAIVSIESGVEGLVHISKLGGGRRLASANEVVKEGEEIEVVIASPWRPSSSPRRKPAWDV
jgi:small subunit ribosomal protein S1